MDEEPQIEEEIENDELEPGEVDGESDDYDDEVYSSEELDEVL